jgi:dTDP-4-dehydrorhamnose reductase
VKVLITGAKGQLGNALTRLAPAGFQLVLKSHIELDISDASQVRQLVSAERVDLIINAAAYTAVDKAESDQQSARAVNADGPANLASAAHACGARLLHVSTDFVFDGTSSEPYRIDSAVAPLNAYGRTKAIGEVAVATELANHATVRTSWLYAAWGANFVQTMLRLMRERGTVRVVADQVGRPTSANSLAQALWGFAQHPELCGTFHWADAGVASWYDFAVAIAEEGGARKLVPNNVQVIPIATEEYPTPARRPKFSVLDTRSTALAIALNPSHWRAELRRVLDEMSHA